ncbi:MAG: NUDIX hydrolase [Syntrophales bacterium]|nr:NUDIX hydrolase [Syntrophales bacterium]
MKITKRDTVFDGDYLGVVRKHFITDTGQECFWETIERKNIYNGGAVVIVALTKKRELILERNWRVPIESFVIQFPAGLTDKKGESEEEAARRELLEETGYRAEKLIPIISVPLCPALATTRATHFFAPVVEFIGNTIRDATEKIEVLKVPLEELDHFLFNLPEDTELDLRVPGILRVLERRGLL